MSAMRAPALAAERVRPGVCEHCARAIGPNEGRLGRCRACYEYRRRTGHDRPLRLAVQPRRTRRSPITAAPIAAPTLGTRSTSTRERLGWASRCAIVWSACPACGRETWVPLKWEGHRCKPCNARLHFQPIGARAKKPGAGAKQRRELNHQWNGGVRTLPDGYRAILVDLDDPFRVMADRHGYVMEHRLVMARAIGRPLRSWEVVHHRNGQRADNREENLELWIRPHPSGHRLADHHCPGCRCFEDGGGS